MILGSYVSFAEGWRIGEGLIVVDRYATLLRRQTSVEEELMVLRGDGCSRNGTRPTAKPFSVVPAFTEAYHPTRK